MEKIKVLNILGSINLGGGAKNVLTFCRNAPSEVEYHICALITEGDKYSDAKKQLPFVFCANGNFEVVREYIETNKINILHFYTRGSFTLLEMEVAKYAKQNNLKVVNTNIFGEYLEEHQKLIDKNIFKSKHCLVYKYAPQASLQITEKSDFFENNFVIPNPVDFTYMQSLIPSQKDIEEYKIKLNIKKDDFVIGKIGSRKALEKWSNILLYMFPHVLKKHPNTVLLLQGVPESRLNWVKKFGDNVRILNETSDDKELALRYSILDIFTHASKIGEHSGNSINDACVYKLPIIMNITPKKDNGQIEQIVDGENGYLTNSVQKYASHVCKLLEDKDLRQQIGQNAYDFVKKNNDIKKLSQDLLNVYSSFYPNNKEYNYSISKQDIIDYKNNYPSLLSNLLKNNEIEFKYKILEVYYKFKDYFEQNY